MESIERVTTAEVRDGYGRELEYMPPEESRLAQFDRWLVEHDAEVAATALESAADRWYSVDADLGGLVQFVPMVKNLLRGSAAAIRSAVNNND